MPKDYLCLPKLLNHYNFSDIKLVGWFFVNSLRMFPQF